MNSKSKGVMLSCFLSSMFFLIFLYVLKNGHLHEDAYILFQYSKKFAQGKGIVFDELSGPTEGATDFLWMLVLGVGKFLGCDIAVLAGVLNTIGLLVIFYVMYKLRTRIDVILVLGFFTILFSGGSSAALGGFSTLAYSAVFSLLIYFAIKKDFFYIWFFSLLISLFRPDGVILSLGVITATFFQIQKSDRKQFIYTSIPFFILGILYFLWRLYYFGMLLPLPLMVKQKSDVLFEGLTLNIRAISNYLFLFAVLVVSLFQNQWRKKDFILIISGPFLLFCALAIAHQSQNIGYRFQFPIVVSILLIAMRVLNTEKLGSWKKLLITITFIIPVERGVNTFRKDIRLLTNNDYINSFPQLLKKEKIELKNIAITEAGRFPYWLDSERMVDIVGLNSKFVVQTSAEDALKEFSPEVIFVHHVGRFQIFQNTDEPFVLVSTDEIILNPYEGANPVYLAPEAALRYAQRNGFQALFVKFGLDDRSYFHVYFLSKSIDSGLFQKILKESFQTQLSYLDSTFSAE